MTEFQEFSKIPRLLKLPMVLTEKIDGTNAQIYIPGPGEEGYDDGKTILAGSRNRWVTPGNDNFGFARWVEERKSELLALGPGRHFGEWWGHGIQRGYGLKEKRFSLFNVSKWSSSRPECCGVVPVLYNGPFSQSNIERVKEELLKDGSRASPGFMKPEGVIIYILKANLLFKSTYENDDESKWMTK